MLDTGGRHHTGKTKLLLRPAGSVPSSMPWRTSEKMDGRCWPRRRASSQGDKTVAPAAGVLLRSATDYITECNRLLASIPPREGEDMFAARCATAVVACCL